MDNDRTFALDLINKYCPVLPKYLNKKELIEDICDKLSESRATLKPIYHRGDYFWKITEKMANDIHSKIILALKANYIYDINLRGLDPRINDQDLAIHTDIQSYLKHFTTILQYSNDA